MKICALIAARGGSKGIKDKNLQEICGKSLVERSAAEASAAGFDRVIVYSDSEKILEAGKRGGAVPVERPNEVSGDSITTEDTAVRFLNDYDNGSVYDALAVIQCTTPFLKSKHMRSCVEIMRSGNHDSVITATRFTRFLGYLGAKSKKWIPVYPYRFLRQEYDPPFFIENGGVYLATRGLWGNGRRMGSQCGVVLMDWWESLEIDEPEDLDVARAIAKHYIKE